MCGRTWVNHHRCSVMSDLFFDIRISGVVILSISCLPKWLYWCVHCVCLSHSLSTPPLASSLRWKGEQSVKPSSPITASHTVRPMWPRYGTLFEVVDGNWMLRGTRQNHKVSEETRPRLFHRFYTFVCGNKTFNRNLFFICRKFVCDHDAFVTSHGEKINIYKNNKLSTCHNTASTVVDFEFEPRSSQTKFVFAASSLSIQHWWLRAKPGWLGIRIMCPGETFEFHLVKCQIFISLGNLSISWASM